MQPASHDHGAGRAANEAVALLASRPGERVLHLGCGDGYLSEELARRGAEVVGFDYNPQRVYVARSRGVDAHLGDAQELFYHQEFDAVFSYAALHWMRRAYQVAYGACMALKPGGRFVGEFSGAGHAQLIRRAIHGALERRSVGAEEHDLWYLPTAGEYQQVLESAGLHVNYISWFEQPQVLEYPIDRWVQTFCSPYLELVPFAARAGFLDEVTEELAMDLLDSSGQWRVDATRLRFKATRKG